MRFVKYILFLMLIMLIIPIPAFASGTSGAAPGGVTLWEAFFMMLTVIPVSKMFSQIFMKLVVRQGVVNEESLAGMGMGILGGIGGFVAMGKVVGGAIAGKGMFGKGGNKANVSGDSYGPRGGSGGSHRSTESTYKSPGETTSTGSPGGSSYSSPDTGASPPGSYGPAPRTESRTLTAEDIFGKSGRFKPSEGDSSGGPGGPGHSLSGPGLHDTGGPGGASDPGFHGTDTPGSYGPVEEPDYRHQPGSASLLPSQQGDPNSFDKIMSDSSHLSDKAAEIAGGLGAMGSLGVPGVMPLVSGVSAGIGKIATHGITVLGKTGYDFTKQMKLHGGNAREAIKAMSGESSALKGGVKMGVGVIASFAGYRAGHAGAKYSSMLMGGSQKAYQYTRQRVDNMVRYKS